MANRMNIAHTATGKGTACVECTPLHILTGFQIAAVLKSHKDIVMDQLHSFFCQFIFQLRIVGLIGIGLHRVSQGIHTCRCGGIGRQAYGQFRIKDRILRNQERIVDSRFSMSFGIGDNRCNRGFRTGTCRCRDGHEGWMGQWTFSNPCS